jgi:hypothetical protein
VTQPEDGSTTYLTYAMTTNPDPLEVSAGPKAPSNATLTFAASVPRSAGECTVGQIIIQIPVGDISDSTNLTNVAPPLSAASISSSDGAVWTPSQGVSAGAFVFTPPNGSALMSTQGLTIQLAGIQISPVVGTSQIKILEWASPSTYPPPPDRGAPSGTATISASKFPVGFYAFDFTPTEPQVNIGDQATLTWVASANADTSITYSDQKPIRVSGGQWTSPPLYTTTVFILTASATVAGQTVQLTLNATVVVATPSVVEFFPTPNSIDYQQQVTLNWHAVNADGVYLLTDQTGKQTLPVVSDPKNPVYLTPAFGHNYALQAFKNQGGTQVLSAAFPLSFTFNQIQIVTWQANPMTVDLQNQATTLTWDVAHAVSVRYQGNTVPASSTSVEHPQSNAQYNLAASWVDGSVVNATPINVTVLNIQIEGYGASFNQNGNNVSVTITITVANATAVSVANAHMMFSTTHHWYQWGQQWTSPNIGGSCTQVDATHWQVALEFDGLDGNAINYANAGVCFDINTQGFYPQNPASNIAMWRGSFNFWNGS